MSNELDMLIQSEPCGEFYRDKNVLLIAPFVYKTLCRHIIDLFSFGSSESLSQATYTRDLTSLLLVSGIICLLI